MYARQIGINASTGFFFTCMALGMAVSRLFSGRSGRQGAGDAGHLCQPLCRGGQLLPAGRLRVADGRGMPVPARHCSSSWRRCWALGLASCSRPTTRCSSTLPPTVSAAPPPRPTSRPWDVGIGLGMLLGGYIAEISTFDKAYLTGACLTVVSTLYFHRKVVPHYRQNKCR